MKSKTDEMTLKLVNHINKIFDEEEGCVNYISPEEVEEFGNEFITALAVLAPATIYSTLTNYTDALRFTHTANLLAFQYLRDQE